MLKSKTGISACFYFLPLLPAFLKTNDRIGYIR
jgi:hypothetical protein